MSYPPYQQQQPYGQPPYYGGGYPPQPPPGPYQRPPAPPGPPPPLPQGWVQEWEPGYRRAYFIEQSTGRTQWEPPYMGQPAGYPPPSMPPPEPYYDQSQREQSNGESNTGKMLAIGAAGLALGAVGGAIIEHELEDGGSSSSHGEEEVYEGDNDGGDDY